MKNTLKKAISIMLVSVMLWGISAAGMSFVANAEETFTENGFTYTVTDETATITDCGSLSGDITIPETLGGYPVTALGKSSFANCGEIGTLYIHEGITDIDGYPYVDHKGVFATEKVKFFEVDENNPNYSSDENGVLYNSYKTVLYRFPTGSSIKRFTVPEGVKEIAEYAFRSCQNLEWIDTGDTVEIIGSSSVSNCNNLIGADIGDSVKYIYSEAFGSNEKLQVVNIGSSLETISYKAFLNCCGLTELNFPSTLRSVDSLAFFGCNNIERFNVEEGGEYCSSDEYGVLFGEGGTELIEFPPASKITEYEIPDTVKNIYPSAFGYYPANKNLEKITGGAGLEFIGIYAFNGCESLEEVILDDGPNELTLESEVFSYCPRLRKVVFPDNLTTVEYTDIFKNCYNLESVTVGSKLAEAKFVKSPSREGCKFLGWYAGDTKVESPYATNGERLTLTAVFEPMKYNITLDAEGGMFEGNEICEFAAFLPGEKITGLPEPVKAGFEFAGWDGMPENGIMPEKSITLKARWNVVSEPTEALSIRAELLYLDKETNEWIVTEKVTQYDELKLRFYIDTSYYTSSGKFIVLYENNTYGGNFETGKTYALNMNTDSESLAAKTSAYGKFTVNTPGSEFMNDLLESGCIDEDTAKSYGAILIDFRLGGYFCQKISGDKWFAEIDLKTEWQVMANAEFMLLGETLASVDNPEGYTDIPIGMEKASLQNTESLSGTKVISNFESTGAGSQVSVAFYAGEGKFKNGSWKFFGFGHVGDPMFTFAIDNPPTREGYTFAGWVDENGNLDVFPEYLGRESLSYHAVWDINSYNVHFETNMSEEFAPEEYTYSEEISAFGVEPKVEGFTFDGWYYEDGTKVVFPFDMPANDITVYAGYKVNDYAVVFNSMGGTPVETVTAQFGAEITYPDAPEKEGHKFMGWSTEIGGEPVDVPEVMPADGLILYAVWETLDYTVRYRIGDQTEEFTAAYGSEIPVPDMTAYKDVEFVEWRNSAGETVEIPETMPAADLEFTAKLIIKETFENPELSAEYDDDCFVEDVKLVVNEIDGESRSGNVYLVEGEFYYQIGYMNIKMINENSQVVQPQNGKKVSLRIPVPEKYKGRTDFIINHWFTGGGREQLRTDDGSITVENGYLCFKVGKFSKFEIYVKSATELSKAPSKTSYYYKQELDLSGIEITVLNEDGTVETVTDTSKMKVSGYDPNTVGEQTVTVEYEGETVEFNVTVSYAWWQWIIRILLLGFLWY